jgi:hypothetical protein
MEAGNTHLFKLVWLDVARDMFLHKKRVSEALLGAGEEGIFQDEGSLHWVVGGDSLPEEQRL